MKMQSPPTPRSLISKGFTLIEMLAVVVLIALIASPTIVSVARADHAGAIHSAIWQLQNLDRQGRLTAQSNGHGVVLQILNDGQEVSLRTAGHTDEVIASFELSSTLSLQMTTDSDSGGRPLSSLFIDRNGHSRDAVIEIRSARTPTERWRLFGLTGSFARISSDGSQRQ